jgi:hypothetical protein
MTDGGRAPSPVCLAILNELMEAQAGTGSNSGVPAFVFSGRANRLLHEKVWRERSQTYKSGGQTVRSQLHCVIGEAVGSAVVS